MSQSPDSAVTARPLHHGAPCDTYSIKAMWFGRKAVGAKCKRSKGIPDSYFLSGYILSREVDWNVDSLEANQDIIRNLKK